MELAISELRIHAGVTHIKGPSLQEGLQLIGTVVGVCTQHQCRSPSHVGRGC